MNKRHRSYDMEWKRNAMRQWQMGKATQPGLVLAFFFLSKSSRYFQGNIWLLTFIQKLILNHISTSLSGENWCICQLAVYICLIKKDATLWCDIYIPSGWMFNLLRLWDTSQKLTETWNFNGRSGFRECNVYIKTQAPSISSSPGLSFTGRPVVNLFQPFSPGQELPTLLCLPFLY